MFDDKIYELSSGPDMERGVKVPEGIVDSTRLRKILRINSFISDNQLFKPDQDHVNSQTHVENTGIWIVPSYLNNSCLANSVRLFLSDFIMIYASRDIEKDEEITISYKSSQSYKSHKEVSFFI